MRPNASPLQPLSTPSDSTGRRSSRIDSRYMKRSALYARQQELTRVARQPSRVFCDNHSNLSGATVRKQPLQLGPLHRDPADAGINVHLPNAQSVPLGVAPDRPRLSVHIGRAALRLISRSTIGDYRFHRDGITDSVLTPTLDRRSSVGTGCLAFDWPVLSGENRPPFGRWGITQSYGPHRAWVRPDVFLSAAPAIAEQCCSAANETETRLVQLSGSYDSA
jgi:hypothetical protein